MKRIVSLLLSIMLVANVAFARNFFEGRFFEVKANVPFGLSNDVFNLDELMVKDLVIDLAKINSEVPKDGLSTIIRMNPNVSTKLRIAGFSLGAKVGVDVYAKLGIGRGLFDLLGGGYNVGDTIDIAIVNPVVDTFAYVDAPIGLEFKKLFIGITPSAFLPVVIMKDSSTHGTVLNNSNGDIRVNLKNDMNFYTNSILGNAIKPMVDSIANPALKNNGAAGNPFDGVTFGSASKYLGFDITANVKYNFSKRSDLRVNARFPILPAKMDSLLNVKNSYEMSGNVMDMATGKMPSQDPFVNDMHVITLDDVIKINRPLKLDAYFDYSLLGFLDFTAGGGFGIRRVGSKDQCFYPEYYASVGVNLFKMLKASISTEYTDQIFMHSLNAVVNLRFVEIDAGVSLESDDFKKSFKGAGVGAYVSAVIGF